MYVIVFSLFKVISIKTTFFWWHALYFYGDNSVSQKNKLLFLSAAAFDKGDDRRLGKKPIFSSSQVQIF